MRVDRALPADRHGALRRSGRPRLREPGALPESRSYVPRVARLGSTRSKRSSPSRRPRGHRAPKPTPRRRARSDFRAELPAPRPYNAKSLRYAGSSVVPPRGFELRRPWLYQATFRSGKRNPCRWTPLDSARLRRAFSPDFHPPVTAQPVALGECVLASGRRATPASSVLAVVGARGRRARRSSFAGVRGAAAETTPTRRKQQRAPPDVVECTKRSATAQSRPAGLCPVASMSTTRGNGL